MILDLNVDHYQCEVFRHSPCYYRIVPCIDSIHRALFLLRRAACNFISSPFQPYHLRLRRRRILIGNLYRTTRFSRSFFSFSFAFSSFSPVPSFRPTASLAEADMEMGRGDGPYEFRARSAFVLPSTEGNRECIFYNAAMSRWPEVVCHPHRLRLTSFGTPVNSRFRRDNLDRSCLSYILRASNLIKDCIFLSNYNLITDYCIITIFYKR